MRAQLVVKGSIVHNRQVVDPRKFLSEKVEGVDPHLMESVSRPNADPSVEEMIEHFEALETAKRATAAIDDDRKKA